MSSVSIYKGLVKPKPKRKITDEQFLEILHSKEKTDSLAEKFKLSVSTISAIRRGKLKRVVE